MLPLLLLLFVGSGCAALIYEIVWFQLLHLVIGSSAVSLGVLLGTFMGGMCAGSLLLPRIISPRQDPLRVYAWLELGIGIIGILVLFAMPHVGKVYSGIVGHGLPGILLRGVVGAVCLLPPTLLMGATLPAISRWIETTPRGVSWLGFFYGGNIAGAVIGCLLAGFYLLRIHDVATATYLAAMINGVVALIASALAVFASRHPGIQAARATAPAETVPDRPGSRPDSAVASPIRGVYPATDSHPRVAPVWPVYLAIALSGMCALGAEVIWTRLLSLILGGTVYTFSIILAVFLTGLGMGSAVGSVLARGWVSPRLALGVCQILAAGAIAWTAHMLSSSVPYWPIDPSLSSSPWFNFQIDLLRCVWATLPATILWGASFPLALAAVAAPGQDPGRLVGGVYAANTAGAILGAIGFSVVMIALVGTRHAQQILIGLSALAAFLAIGPQMIVSLKSFALGATLRSRAWRTAAVLGAVSASVVFIALLARGVPAVPSGLVAYGRYLPSRDNEAAVLYMGEGINASVAVTELDNGTRNFHVSGKIEASSEPQDMRLQRLLGHLPALLHPKPRSVLIVGCGAGVTAGTFVLHPDIERIVICEIEPLIPKVVARHFTNENHNVLNDPRVEVVYDDGRHYVLTTREKFDIITSDPIHPWVRGSATLYTREYFEMVKRHLNPEGLVTQWVPLYESNEDAVKSELATFFDVFPDGTIWSNDDAGQGYDIVLLGGLESNRIDVDGMVGRLDRQDHFSAVLSLDEVGFKSAISLLATYAGQAPDFRSWLEGTEINLDRNLRLQYLAGMGLNLYQSERIYDELIKHVRFPDELFSGSDRNKQELKRIIERAIGRR